MGELPFDLNVGFNSKRGNLKFMPDGSVSSTARFGGVGLGNMLHLFGGSRTGFWTTSLHTPKNVQIEFSSEEKTIVVFKLALIEENVWSSHPDGLNVLQVEDKRNASSASDTKNDAKNAIDDSKSDSKDDSKADSKS